jgi:hypothetical protein
VFISWGTCHQVHKEVPHHSIVCGDRELEMNVAPFKGEQRSKRCGAPPGMFCSSSSQQSYYEIAVWMDLENVTLRGKDKEERV